MQHIPENIKTALEKDGFGEMYIQTDPPGLRYPVHTHPGVIAHVILKGEMRLTVESDVKTLREGDRCDVPANVEHEAEIGSDGCTYVIGE